jgi:transposase
MATIKAEEKLDGKYLLRSSDPSLSAQDIALGYKQLWQIERGWRDMKQVLDLRPVYHRREDRIRAHVVLCWLALLLVRVIETTCEESWPALRHKLEQLQLGSFQGPAGTFRQRSEITASQGAILAPLQLAAPPRLQEIRPAAAVS